MTQRCLFPSGPSDPPSPPRCLAAPQAAPAAGLSPQPCRAPWGRGGRSDSPRGPASASLTLQPPPLACCAHSPSCPCVALLFHRQSTCYCIIHASVTRSVSAECHPPRALSPSVSPQCPERCFLSWRSCASPAARVTPAARVSHGSGDGESKIRALAGLVLGEGSPLGVQMAIFSLCS